MGKVRAEPSFPHFPIIYKFFMLYMTYDYCYAIEVTVLLHKTHEKFTIFIRVNVIM